MEILKIALGVVVFAFLFWAVPYLFFYAVMGAWAGIAELLSGNKRK